MNTPLPYTAISLSVVGRLIFMFLLYRNRSTNSLSLLFCLLNICSSSMWIYYSVQMNDIPMISRSSTEITLLFISAMYIIRRGEAADIAGIKARLRNGRLRKARLRKGRLRKARLRNGRLRKARLRKVVTSICKMKLIYRICNRIIYVNQYFRNTSPHFAV